jgi:hypothetical protein
MNRLPTEKKMIAWMGWAGMSLLLWGCTTAQQVRDTFNPYLGQHYDQVVKALGVPTACTPLSTGDRLCEWDRSYVSYEQGSGGSVDRRYQFVFDKNGQATEWTWRGIIRPVLFYERVTISSKDPVK